ncbi:S26 family signal peptidase [Mesorhizobium sp.]|uniref:S26 family signal peptidase n=1 Tax=Mesorhizobium sp. TaxID=1871066 RepID=UPI001201CEAE|nr:S26 family signal peptidase [Mesorhizobium sp.]TIP11296.1 MAG: S26 family signal peptidase [Mesorhizobium sp.]
MSRAAITLTMLVSCALIAEPTWRDGGPTFIWNASRSVPIGLYRLTALNRVEAPDLVAVIPPDPLAGFLAERGYLARGVPLLKRVLAVAGDTVCREGRTIVAFDHVYGEARERDSQGRPLPTWQGCRTLAKGEVFLMNWDAADSFDGRYFGPLPVNSVVARAMPIWTDEHGDGRFHWHIGDPPDVP